ncbi:Tryptophan halogenase [Stieleria bergensis]|uniref:Tryptophan halogenase n=1 Tax=Stieleria bergensis TaxID=2528025 RepID=A0A517SXQ5_9BACT|nr:Tryptophan halogenase [Planctomycetes bacterium SV_7m_r]
MSEAVNKAAKPAGKGNHPTRSQVAIIGGSFSASILARILSLKGYSVVLIDAGQHPRFAIGESSTPIADLLLRRLGEEYGLPDLVAMSSYGAWQTSHQRLACGLKRGFSYFDHRGTAQGDAMVESKKGQRSLLVAASPTDQRSDTHWFRSDVDAFLFDQAKRSGVRCLPGSSVVAIDTSPAGRHMLMLQNKASVQADFVIDASGRSAVTAQLLGGQSLLPRLQTNSVSAFSHFTSVASFGDHFNDLHQDQRASHPFHADAAAQHHLLDRGWVWMLRFNNGVTSVGVTAPCDDQPASQVALGEILAAELQGRFSRYPALRPCMRHAKLAEVPGQVLVTGRLQRLNDPVVSDSIVMMPTTAVTIDPLHSTGIAHALSGVQRMAHLLDAGVSTQSLETYRQAVLDEAALIDQMVSLAYHCMSDFPRFCMASMLYFAAAIQCEEQLLAGQWPNAYWMAQDQPFLDAMQICYQLLRSTEEPARILSQMQSVLAPWNQAGLLDPAALNRYAYTATK